MFSASLPDHYETYRPKLDGPNAPFVPGKEPGTFVANEAYKNLPGAVFRLGNISRMMNASVHSVEDVVLTATGPGSERVRGQIDNTEVFRLMAEALGLGHVALRARRADTPVDSSHPAAVPVMRRPNSAMAPIGRMKPMPSTTMSKGPSAS